MKIIKVKTEKEQSDLIHMISAYRNQSKRTFLKKNFELQYKQFTKRRKAGFEYFIAYEGILKRKPIGFIELLRGYWIERVFISKFLRKNKFATKMLQAFFETFPKRKYTYFHGTVRHSIKLINGISKQNKQTTLKGHKVPVFEFIKQKNDSIDIIRLTRKEQLKYIE